jgi:hypothetical protein
VNESEPVPPAASQNAVYVIPRLRRPLVNGEVCAGFQYVDRHEVAQVLAPNIQIFGAGWPTVSQSADSIITRPDLKL